MRCEPDRLLNNAAKGVTGVTNTSQLSRKDIVFICFFHIMPLWLCLHTAGNFAPFVPVTQMPWGWSRGMRRYRCKLCLRTNTILSMTA